MLRRVLFWIILLLGLSHAPRVDADQASLVHSVATTPELSKLVSDYEATRSKFGQTLASAKDQSTRDHLAVEIRTAQTDFSRRFLQLAQESVDPRVAIRAAVWIMVNDAHSSLETAAALKQLVLHKEHDDLADVAGLVSMWPPSVALDEFFSELDKSNNQAVKMRSKYAQALHGMAALDAAHRLRGYSERKQQTSLDTARREIGEATVTQLLSLDDATLTKRIESLLQEVTLNGRDIPSIRGSLADTARADLFELKNLGIGQIAPEITGVDLTGTPMKLSDFRGKVVLLNFWGSWCPQCMQLLPQERAIAEALAAQPFVQLGVNNDDDVAAAQKAVEQEEMTWRSWRDGDRTTGKVASQWNVKEWPTFYVIDADGVIRHKVKGVEAAGLTTSVAPKIDELIQSMASDRISTRAWLLFGGGAILTGLALVRAVLQRTPGAIKIGYAAK